MAMEQVSHLRCYFSINRFQNKTVSHKQNEICWTQHKRAVYLFYNYYIQIIVQFKSNVSILYYVGIGINFCSEVFQITLIDNLAILNL